MPRKTKKVEASPSTSTPLFTSTVPIYKLTPSTNMSTTFALVLAPWSSPPNETIEV
jgi:hypothetical protein